MKKRLTFGVIASECNREYTSQVLSGMIEQAFICGCDLIIMSAMNNFQPPLHIQKQYEADIYKLALSDSFDGFVYDRNYIYNDDIVKETDKLLRSTNKPVITLDSLPQKYFGNVISHDYDAFARLAEHLINDHGFRKIYCLTGTKGYIPSEERLAAYLDTMKKYRLHYDSTYYGYGDFWKDSPVRLAKMIIDHKLDTPEAIMCANDVMAEALIEALQKGGIRVPEDIAVTGYDGYTDNTATDPWLTTHRKNGFDLGAEAVRKLYGSITGKNCRRVYNKPDDLIIGGSCGCSCVTKNTSLPRDRKMKKICEERFRQSNMLFDVMHCTTVPELVITLSGNLYLLYGWRRFRIFLTEPYLRMAGKSTSLRYDPSVSLKEMMWCDAAGNERLDTTAFPLWYLPEHISDARFPAAYYVTPLHINENFYGIAALSYGKRSGTYPDNYISFINYITAALEQIAVRNSSKRSKDSVSSDSTRLYEMLCDLRKNMHDFPEKDRNIDSMSESVNVSRSYLQRMYKSYFGKSIFEELIYYRMEKAKKLLAQTKSSVSEIAELCGYASYNHFVRQFRQSENLTPTEYRKKVRGSRNSK